MTIADLDLDTPGALWDAVRDRTQAALAAGALRPVATHAVTLEQAGVRFVVRVAENLRRKAQGTGAKPPGFNPFLPPEPALTVGAVGAQHLAVLNKFNVVDRHLLLVTRAFEAQERLLGAADLTALWRCLAVGDGLGFYNGGPAAGASQRHKHLQLVPLPLAETEAVPMAALFDPQPPGRLTVQPRLPVPHRFAALPTGLADDPAAAARLSGELYRAALAALGLAAADSVEACPYNLLLTRDWLLVVPRTREHAGPISINGLGFAGSLFVRDEEELEAVRRTGPMGLLQAVTS